MRFLVLVMFLVVLPEMKGIDILDVNHNQKLSDLNNCTQSMVELLLRQDTHPSQLANLGRHSAAATLEGMVNLLNELRVALLDGQHAESIESKRCLSPYTLVGQNCLMMALNERLSWASAQHYCEAIDGDLATFSDASTYAEYLVFVNSVNSENTAVSAWIGGTDEDSEGMWTWHTGDLMPRGPPFWGSTNGYKPEPSGGRRENCAILYYPDKYYVHDISCTFEAAPLCKKRK